MKKYVVRASLVTLPPLISGQEVSGNKKFDNLEDAKSYAQRFKSFLNNKTVVDDEVSYTDEEKEFFGGCHAALFYDGIDLIEITKIE